MATQACSMIEEDLRAQSLPHLTARPILRSRLELDYDGAIVHMINNCYTETSKEMWLFVTRSRHSSEVVLGIRLGAAPCSSTFQIKSSSTTSSSDHHQLSVRHVSYFRPRHRYLVQHLQSPRPHGTHGWLHPAALNNEAKTNIVLPFQWLLGHDSGVTGMRHITLLYLMIITRTQARGFR